MARFALLEPKMVRPPPSPDLDSHSHWEKTVSPSAGLVVVDSPDLALVPTLQVALEPEAAPHFHLCLHYLFACLGVWTPVQYLVNGPRH